MAGQFRDGGLKKDGECSQKLRGTEKDWVAMSNVGVWTEMEWGDTAIARM